MKIVSWNCHMGLTIDKVNKLLENDSFNDADIYAIQECEENDITPEIEQKLGHLQNSWYGDHKEYEWYHKGDLGIALFSNKFRIERINKNEERFRYVVPYKVTNDKTNESFILVHIWTKTKDRENNPNEDYLMFVLNAMKEPEYSKYLFPSDNKVIWLGDFNWSPQLSSYFAKNIFSLFGTSINKALYSTYHKYNQLSLGEEKKMTFFSTKSKAYFNDYIFVGKKAFTIKQVYVGSKENWQYSDCNKTYYSDHCPIMANLNLNN
ncbi:MAG: endonuclease/exonuclease/phosphatase family protein [Treponema sp.]|nr:endonuclease/exonuclease/phosphatase family protein [Treponema sp.]